MVDHVLQIDGRDPSGVALTGRYGYIEALLDATIGAPRSGHVTWPVPLHKRPFSGYSKKEPPLIIEIPTARDFTQTGLHHLHMAWDIGMQLSRELRDAEFDGPVEVEVTDEYWLLAQPLLANAFTLIHQAQEFKLKAKITDVSPFLLMSREPLDWPKRCDKRDTPFSAFRMADAADLIKLHDTVATLRLPAEFRTYYDEIRRQRNLITHVGAGWQRITIRQLLIAILRTYSYLFVGDPWPRRRREYLRSDRLTAVYSNDHAGDVLLSEFDMVVEHLKPAELRRFFEFDKRARRYICPHCINEADDERIALAQLRPNKPESTEVYCFVCGTSTVVVRQRCSETGCLSNVLLEDGSCLVCW